jgi:hypothetical protein
MKKLFGLFFILLFASCATTKFNLRPDTHIESLSICISYSDRVPEDVMSSFDQALSDFIFRYNNEPHAFRLSFCDDANRSALLIDVKETILVSKERQVSSTFITLAGMSLPFIMMAAHTPVFLFFYSIPNDVSVINLQLSGDLTTAFYSFNGNITNSGYLLSQEKQIRNHGIAFNNYLNGFLRQLEKQYIEIQKPYPHR